MEQLAHRLRRLSFCGPREARTSDLEALAVTSTGDKVHDLDFSGEGTVAFFELLAAALSWPCDESSLRDTALVEAAFLGIATATEFGDFADAKEEVVIQVFLRAVAGRLDGTCPQEEWPFLRELLLWLYERFAQWRVSLRALIGQKLRTFALRPSRTAPVAPLLQVLRSIIAGFQLPLEQVHRRLLFDILVPLHKPSGWLQWDRQTPLIVAYHEDLVCCTQLVLAKDSSLAAASSIAICSYFPQASEANTPKEVMLL